MTERLLALNGLVLLQSKELHMKRPSEKRVYHLLNLDVCRVISKKQPAI